MEPSTNLAECIKGAVVDAAEALVRKARKWIQLHRTCMQDGEAPASGARAF